MLMRQQALEEWSTKHDAVVILANPYACRVAFDIMHPHASSNKPHSNSETGMNDYPHFIDINGGSERFGIFLSPFTGQFHIPDHVPGSE